MHINYSRLFFLKRWKNLHVNIFKIDGLQIFNPVILSKLIYLRIILIAPLISLFINLLVEELKSSVVFYFLDIHSDILFLLMLMHYILMHNFILLYSCLITKLYLALKLRNKKLLMVSNKS